MPIFILPLIVCYNLLKIFIGSKITLYCIYVFYHLSLIYSLVFVYRTLYEVVRIKQYRAIILTVLFASFAHIIMQAFIIETYSLSLLLLTLTIYILGKEICLKEKTSSAMYGLLFILSAGVTITNGVKIILGYFFTERKAAIKIRWLLIVSLVFAVLMMVVYIPSKVFGFKNIKTELSPNHGHAEEKTSSLIGQSVNTEVEAAAHTVPFLEFVRFDINLLSSVRGNVLGESALFHTSDFKKEIENGRDVYIEYVSPFYNWVIACFYTFLGLAIISSFNQKYSQTLLVFLSADIFIHIICRFGITEPYIFAAHWMFLVPLFLGFLYTNKRLNKLYYFFDCSIFLFAAFFLYSNWGIVFEYLSSSTHTSASTYFHY